MSWRQGPTCHGQIVINLKYINCTDLTLVGLGESVLVNEVTIVVNCYGVVSPSQDCCKSDLHECYCVDITLEFKYWNNFCEARRDFLQTVY